MNTSKEYPFSEKDLNAFEIKIRASISRTNENIERLREDSMKNIVDGSDEYNVSYSEDGRSSQERTRLTELIEQESKYLVKLEAALARIENQTYGICTETGNFIRKERLLAEPTATTCI